ncbi:MAG: hypothetical protein K0S74_42 [Chlamydiales bacterium]|jgi:hypothetical protein|nr:hypothetical protein [Chlamydiales bacterium]
MLLSFATKYNSFSCHYTSQESKEDTNYFESLPHEIIAHIFSYLTRNDFSKVSLLNRNLQQILWDTFDFSRSQGTIAQVAADGKLEALKRLLKCSQLDPAEAGLGILKMPQAAICEASHNGQLSIVKELMLDPRVDPSANHSFALRLASRYGYVSIVKELLQDPRVDPAAVNNESIRLAMEQNHVSTVKELLGNTKVNPFVDMELIEKIIKKGFFEIVELLLCNLQKESFNGEDKKSQSSNSYFQSPLDLKKNILKYSIEMKDSHLLEFLLKTNYVNPTVNEHVAIRYASHLGNELAVTQLMADVRIDPSAKSNSALKCAIDRAHTNIAQLLLKDKRVINQLRTQQELAYKLKRLLMSSQCINNATTLLMT